MWSSRLRLSFLLILICCARGTSKAQDRSVQTPAPVAPAAADAAQDDETIRVNTELIQTSISVFDKQGRYIDKLKQEDFELRVDGKPLPISFFERVEAGGKAVRPPAAAAAERGGGRDMLPQIERRGRAVIFLVDDLHLSLESLKRTRDLLLRFVDQEVAADDQIVIASPSGKLGFLQQFTDSKTMLRAAVERLRQSREGGTSAMQRPPMSEYEALLVDRYDREVTQFFAAALLRDRLALNMEDAETQVRSRARGVLQYAAINSKNTYAALEQVLRSSAQLPMRKLVFFISDGFFLDTTNTDSAARLRRIADAATRANAVIYSFDIKGLEAGMPEGGGAAAFRVQSGERWEAQDPLNVVAVSTGGRFVRNTNDLQTGVTAALKETSAYYLLVWRPDPERKGSDKLRRIEVSVKGRPDLSVLVQSGYLDAETKPAAEAARAPKTTPRQPTAEDQLRAAFNSVVPARALPTTLVVNYLDTPTEGALSAVAMQIERGAVEFTAAGDKAVANVGVVGAIFNSQGKQEAFFRQRLTLTAPVARGDGVVDDSDIFYNYQAKLRPGLYQVRVAARDEKSGRTGSASQWIEIPDLTSRKLTLSSLLLGERTTADGDGGARQQQAASANKSVEAGVDLAINRSFARTSHLRYLVYIYNAAREGNGGRPDVGVLTQVLNGARPVMTSSVVQVSSEGQDASRLAYAAEIPLASLTKGLYVLKVTVVDRVTKKSVTQSVEFKLK